MELSYSQADAHAWAAFSGDFNPIHFSSTLPSGAESMAMSVHGMRALLDIKEAMTDALAPENRPAWLRFTARLQQPLKCGEPASLSLERRGQQINGQLQQTRCGTRCMTARLAPGFAPEMTGIMQQGDIDAATRSQLREGYPGVSAADKAWVFLDALLFKKLLASQAFTGEMQRAFGGHPFTSLMDIFSETGVVQTHHETLFSPSLIAASESKTMLWGILPALVSGDIRTGVICHITVVAWTHTSPLIATSLTLKSLPVSAINQ